MLGPGASQPAGVAASANNFPAARAVKRGQQHYPAGTRRHHQVSEQIHHIPHRCASHHPPDDYHRHVRRAAVTLSVATASAVLRIPASIRAPRGFGPPGVFRPVSLSIALWLVGCLRVFLARELVAGAAAATASRASLAPSWLHDRPGAPGWLALFTHRLPLPTADPRCAATDWLALLRTFCSTNANNAPGRSTRWMSRP